MKMKTLFALLTTLVAGMTTGALWAMEEKPKNEKMIIAYVHEPTKNIYVLVERKTVHFWTKKSAPKTTEKFSAPLAEDVASLTLNKAREEIQNIKFYKLDNAMLPKIDGKIFNLIKLTVDAFANPWPVEEGSFEEIYMLDSSEEKASEKYTGSIDESFREQVKHSGLISYFKGQTGNNKISSVDKITWEIVNIEKKVETPFATPSDNNSNNNLKPHNGLNASLSTNLLSLLPPLIAAIGGGICGWLTQYCEENIKQCRQSPLKTRLMGLSLCGAVAGTVTGITGEESGKHVLLTIGATIAGGIAGYFWGKPAQKKMAKTCTSCNKKPAQNKGREKECLRFLSK